MERSARKYSLRPARCPGCGQLVHLLVGHSGKITVHMHNTDGCNKTFYYRCWIENGLPLPRVEFLDEANAMHFTLHPHQGDSEPIPAASPSPSAARLPPSPPADVDRPARAHTRQPVSFAKPDRPRARR